MSSLWKRTMVVGLTLIFIGSGAVTCGAADEAERDVGLILRAICRYDGEIPEDGSLTFVLWDGQCNILQMVVNLRQHAAFAPLHFETAGRYIYYISQEGSRDISVAYDPTVYQIVVEVTEWEGGLSAAVTEVNRVRGDFVGEPQIVEMLEANADALFENRTREVPSGAEVPGTGDGTRWWQVVSLISVGALLLAAMKSRRYRK